jgi:hypothetical protein
MSEVNTKRETARLAFLAGLAMVVALGFLPWGIETMRTNPATGAGIFALGAAAIAASAWLFVRERRKISSGLPMQDERSKGIFQKAASYSFYTTLYFLLALAFLSDEPRVREALTVYGALMLTLAEMVLAVFVFLAYFHLKGVPE